MTSSPSDRVATPNVEVISGRCARGNGKLHDGHTECWRIGDYRVSERVLRFGNLAKYGAAHARERERKWTYRYPDSAFRWSSCIWIFNMATNNVQANTTYRFRINLKDGTGIEFVIGVT